LNRLSGCHDTLIRRTLARTDQWPEIFDAASGPGEPVKIGTLFYHTRIAMASLPVITPYTQLGGEPAVRELVDRFYAYMDTLPEARGIRAMHPEDLAGSKDKLFKFLSGWLGGPNLFEREYGHPRLRMRHFPFAIGLAERDRWLDCMARALDDMALSPALREALMAAFAQTATHMINRTD
jgi:hemoglobin